MVKSSKKLVRKVAKYEKKLEARGKQQNGTSYEPVSISSTVKKESSKRTKIKSKKSSKNTNKSVTKVILSNEQEDDDSTNPQGLSEEEKKALKLDKLREKLRMRKIAQASSGVKDTDTAAMHAVRAITKKGGTTLNLSCARRHDVFVSELNQFNMAMSLDQFKADPFGSIEAHLMQTAPTLKRQTADGGRKLTRHEEAVKRRAPKHAKYGRGNDDVYI
eukprot:Tbor_TRINITY_DN2456_c0_g1::TRINITY_DN2456_c0_g1_i1::g.2665::m.2665